MIEYILARPFITLFFLSAIVTLIAINSASSFQFKVNPITCLSVLTLGIICLFYSKMISSAVICIAISILCLNIKLHLNRAHCLIKNTESELNDPLTIVSCNKIKNKFIVETRNMNTNDKTSIQVEIPERYLSELLFYGDTLFCQYRLNKVYSVNNRYFSSFNNYLINEHIFYMARLTDSVITFHKSKKFSIFSFSQKLSNICRSIFIDKIKDTRIANLMIALLLGDKANLDKEIKTDFINNGTAHILAVSGLHLGMIYGMIQFVTSLLKSKRIEKKKHLSDVLLVLGLVWLFACISGLGASVLRAAVMLTVLETGNYLKRNTDSVNNLFSCGFTMLFIDPCTLFDIGFMLSFTAVLSIVLFNPFINRIWIPETQILRSIRDLLSVTTAVQLLVTPISVYYFQQFPLTFLLSNIVWVPLSFILMLNGIALVAVSSILPGLSHWIGNVSIFLCNLGLAQFQLINGLPVRALNTLWIYPEEVAEYLFSMIMIYLWMKFNRSKLLIIGLSAFTLIPFGHLIRNEQHKRSRELIIYYENKSVQIDIRRGQILYTSNLNSRIMQKYRSAFPIHTVIQYNTFESFQSELINSSNELILPDQESTCASTTSLKTIQHLYLKHYPDDKKPGSFDLTDVTINRAFRDYANFENLYPQYNLMTNEPIVIQFRNYAQK